MRVCNLYGRMWTCGHRYPQNLEDDVGSLKLEWILGTKPQSSAKAVSALNTEHLYSPWRLFLSIQILHQRV